EIFEFLSQLFDLISQWNYLVLDMFNISSALHPILFQLKAQVASFQRNFLIHRQKIPDVCSLFHVQLNKPLNELLIVLLKSELKSIDQMNTYDDLLIVLDLFEFRIEN